MSNSALVSYTKLSPNHSGPRTHAIDTITIHCMAGNLSVETCGALFADSARQASSNYGIGSDGRIALYVDEANRSWCSSNAANDQRAVTIEVANSVAADPWPVSDAAYAALLDLVTDICRRNGIPKLLWQADKSLIGQVDKQNMTVHRWFAAKACPGDYLYSRHAEIAAEVNKRLAAQTDVVVYIATGTVTATTLNVRSGPSTAYSILGTLSKGAAVSITGKSGDWYQIGYKGTSAFVSAQYIQLTQETAKTPETDTSTTTEEDDTMTQEQFNSMMATYLTEQAGKDDASWGAEWEVARQWAESNGVIVGDSDGNMQYQSWTTRQMMVLMLYRQEQLAVRYSKLADIPESSNFQKIIELLMNAGIILGDGSDPDGNGDVINLSEDMVRMLVYNYRAGCYDDKILDAGYEPGLYR